MMPRLPRALPFFAVGLAAGVLATATVAPLAGALPAAAQDGDSDDPELQELLAEERALGDRSRRSGEVRRALRTFEELIDEDPADVESRLGRARCLVDLGLYEESRADLERALSDGRSRPGAEGRSLRAAIVRALCELDLEQGRTADAARRMADADADLDPLRDPRDALLAARVRWLAGNQAGALEVWRAGANAPLTGGWERLLAKARCERHLGWLERASQTLVEAADAAQAEEGGGPEPDVLVELADLYVEADGEVEHAESAGRSPGPLYRQALSANPRHEAALLGQFRLHRLNWRRQSRPPHEILGALLDARPGSVAGLVAGAEADLEDGQLRRARERLARLARVAPDRREVRTLEAALAWIEHRQDEAEAILAQLAREVPYDARPEREVGRTLNELYRFAEAREFALRATERDPSDHRAWTQLARSLANTGDEPGARAAFEEAEREARGRHDVWRNNMGLVLQRLEEYTEERGDGELVYVWSGDASDVLRTYWLPFYASAREELAARYGYTPDEVRIEIFRRHEDFSVRSTGYEGFPALGVCFGPVVTSVSPLSELRGTFAWSRTAFHEFTHVIHLGLSHNRCPRWITEGLATWEEAQQNPSWARNMRRDLVDAYANGDLIPVRELNRAFRGPRILFGYYQGGLLCEMLVGEYGFAPMVRLLEAFDRGLDLDRALAEVFGKTPEEVDGEFEAFVAGKVADLHVEPRWQPTTRQRLKLALDREPPDEESERAAWAENTATLAWSAWQAGGEVDAQQALRRLKLAGLETSRSLFLRGEMAYRAGQRAQATDLWQAGLEAGGRDYRVRMALGKLAQADGDLEEAERHFLAAERDFPGFPDPHFSAERELEAVYSVEGRTEDLQRVRERWLAFNAGEYDLRVEVGRWHLDEGRAERAAELLDEANQVDPFRRRLHVLWATALLAAERPEEVLREVAVARRVPPELDVERPFPATEEELAELLGLEAEALMALGRAEEARAAAERALELDSGEARAQAILDDPR